MRREFAETVQLCEALASEKVELHVYTFFFNAKIFVKTMRRSGHLVLLDGQKNHKLLLELFIQTADDQTALTGPGGH